SLDLPKDPKNPNSQETTRVDVIGAAGGSPNSATGPRLYVGARSLRVLGLTSGPNNVGAPPDFPRPVNFCVFYLIAPAVVPVAQVDLQISPQLGLGNCHSDIDNQHSSAAAAYLEHEICVENAEGPAADERHQRKVQEVLDARSAQAGHEPGNRRADEAG